MRFNSRLVAMALAGLLLALPSAAQLRMAEHATAQAEASTSAFQPGQQAAVAVVVQIAGGFHAQSHKPADENAIPLVVSLEPNPAVTPYDTQYPPGEHVDYPALGKLNVYTGTVVVYVPLQVKPEAQAGPLLLTGHVRMQTCNEAACFPPEKLRFELTAKIVGPGEAVTPNRPDLFQRFDSKVFSKLPPAAPPAGGPPSDGNTGGSGGAGSDLTLFGKSVKDVGVLLALPIALLVGIIFNVMPCVLPVLPLKILGFYETSQHNRARSLLLGTIFSLGIVTTFAVLALLVLIGGRNWGDLFSHGWFVWTLVVVLVGVALSQFGLFTFRLPLGVYTINPSHQTLTGNFLSGIFAAILSTPCTAPIFPGLLAWAIAQPKAIGVGAIVTVGVGMALPYLVLSAMPEVARKLPRSGPWSELVKQMMGFLLLAVAAYFAGLRLLPNTQYVWAVFGVMVAAAVFLIARTQQLVPGVRPFVVSTVVALLLVSATYAGARVLSRHEAWTPFSERALSEARADGRIALVKFTANWCANCQYVEATVFTDSVAKEALRRRAVVMLKADLTTEDAPGWELLRKLNPSGGIPLTAIFAPGRAEPILLSSIYRTPNLTAALDEAARGGGTGAGTRGD